MEEFCFAQCSVLVHHHQGDREHDSLYSAFYNTPEYLHLQWNIVHNINVPHALSSTTCTEMELNSPKTVQPQVGFELKNTIVSTDL